MKMPMPPVVHVAWVGTARILPCSIFDAVRNWAEGAAWRFEFWDDGRLVDLALLDDDLAAWYFREAQEGRTALLRQEVLLRYGGLFLPLDLLPLRSGHDLQLWLERASQAMRGALGDLVLSSTVGDAALAAPAAHPLLQAVNERLHDLASDTFATGAGAAVTPTWAIHGHLAEWQILYELMDFHVSLPRASVVRLDLTPLSTLTQRLRALGGGAQRVGDLGDARGAQAVQNTTALFGKIGNAGELLTGLSDETWHTFFDSCHMGPGHGLLDLPAALSVRLASIIPELKLRGVTGYYIRRAGGNGSRSRYVQSIPQDGTTLGIDIKSGRMQFHDAHGQVVAISAYWPYLCTLGDSWPCAWSVVLSDGVMETSATIFALQPVSGPDTFNGDHDTPTATVPSIPWAYSPPPLRLLVLVVGAHTAVDMHFLQEQLAGFSQIDVWQLEFVVRRVPSLDAGKLPHVAVQLERLGVLAHDALLTRRLHRGVGGEEVAVALGHTFAWRTAWEERVEFALVLEVGVIFRRESLVSSLLGLLAAQPWAVAALGGVCDYGVPGEISAVRFPGVAHPRRAGSLPAYLISASGAKRLLGNTLPLHTSIAESVSKALAADEKGFTAWLPPAALHALVPSCSLAAHTYEVHLVEPKVLTRRRRADPCLAREQTQSFVQLTSKTIHYIFGGSGATTASIPPLQVLPPCLPSPCDPPTSLDEQVLEAVAVASEVDASFPRVQLMCLLYTHQDNHNLVRAAAGTWGRRCDGLAIFTDGEGDFDGQAMFSVPEEARGYNGVWRKVWIAWQFAHSASWFAQWFVLSADDSYWVIENLRLLLRCPRIAIAHARGRPVYLGRRMWASSSRFHQGAGYVLNAAAVAQLMLCPRDIMAEDTSAEDLQVARCLAARGVPPMDAHGCADLGRPSKGLQCEAEQASTVKERMRGRCGDPPEEDEGGFAERFHPFGPGEEASLLDWGDTYAGHFTRAVGMPLIARASVLFHHVATPSKFISFERRLYACRVPRQGD